MKNKTIFLITAMVIITSSIILGITSTFVNLKNRLIMNQQLYDEQNYQYPVNQPIIIQTEELPNINNSNINYNCFSNCGNITNYTCIGNCFNLTNITSTSSTDFNYETETGIISKNYDSYYSNITDDLGGSLTLEGFDIVG